MTIQTNIVSVLRTSKHVQITEILGNWEGGRCALGMIAEKVLKSQGKQIKIFFDEQAMEFDGHFDRLSPALVAKSGLADGLGTFKKPLEHRVTIEGKRVRFKLRGISHANEYGLSFKQIADLIEKNIESVFYVPDEVVKSEPTDKIDMVKLPDHIKRFKKKVKASKKRVADEAPVVPEALKLAKPTSVEVMPSTLPDGFEAGFEGSIATELAELEDGGSGTSIDSSELQAWLKG
jgi:hypothetical protein